MFDVLRGKYPGGGVPTAHRRHHHRRIDLTRRPPDQVVLSPPPGGSRGPSLFLRSTLLSLALLAAVPLPAQVLARPGWAGSGVAPEPWWHRAVFYRIDPARFQDSNGDGTGDLEGIAQRLDYLQSLGIDALILDGPADPNSLEDLVREASRHHLRLLLTLRTNGAPQTRDTLLHNVHDWLSAGAAGVWLPKTGDPTDAAEAAYAQLAPAVRSLIRTFPGERILITDPLPQSAPAEPAPRPIRRGRRHGSVAAPTPANPQNGQLTAAPPLPVTLPSLAALREALTASTQAANPAENSLQRLAVDPATGSPNAAAAAAVLLASRGAALIDFGTEIGLDLYPNSPATTQPVMQWTPSNHTAAPAEHPETTTPAPGSETEFGAYHPYRPPPRDLRGPNTPAAHVIPDGNIPAALPDPDTLPGFTAGTLPLPPIDGSTLNVTTEDRNPKSLLNAYRTLIGLHHDNPTLRNGSQFVLNRDSEGALVWLRRAPAGSRTAANVLAAANLSDHPVTLTLDADIDALGMRGGALRPLLAYASEPLTGETTAHLTLPPHAVLLGEIYHAGSLPTAAEPAHRRSRHRVRR